MSPRNLPPMSPHMIRCTDEEWNALVAATEQRGEFVAEATRRLWAEYVTDALAEQRLAEVLAMPDPIKESQR